MGLGKKFKLPFKLLIRGILLSNLLQVQKKSQKKRRGKYIPGLAYFRFKPEKYWSREEAKQLFEETKHPTIDQDSIIYEDCIIGMEKMASNSVDLVIADPPFGIDYSGKESLYNRNRSYVIDSYQEVKADYDQFTVEWMKSIQRIMKRHATAYVFSGWNHLEDVLRGAREACLSTINHLVWKYQFGVFTRKKYVTSHYHILLLSKDPKKYFFNKIEHYPEDVWIINRRYRRGQLKNGNTLPEEVVRRCIEFSSKPGDLVFDPFMGMATTAVAAKTTHRHYYGFEINRQLEIVVEARLEKSKVGQEHLSFKERRQKRLNEMIEKYPRAYQIYLREERENLGRRQV